METPPATRPLILAVDDDLAVGRSIERDLKKRYGARHRVLLADSGQAGLGMVEQIVRRGEPVALLVADQRMPEMTGVDFLARAIRAAPHARRVLLTAYADTEAAIQAINEVGLDHYLMKPWSPPEERLYPVLDELLEEWEAAAAARLAEPGLRLVGHRFSADAHATRDFLARNGVPYRWLDVADAEARTLLAAAHSDEGELPVLVLEDGEILVRPSQAEIADRIGLRTRATLPFYDLVILGAGPAGLAAAVYGASEGLRTLLVERLAAGGQAGQSSRIENYLGFPKGLSGADLARRATDQARRLGAEMVSREAVGIRENGPARVVALDGGEEIAAHSVLVATGVQYARLDVPGVEALTGAGVYYGAAPAEAADGRGRGGRRRRGGQLGRPGGGGPRRQGPAGDGDLPRRGARGGHVPVPGRAGPGARQRPRDDGRAGGGGRRQRPAGGAERRRRRGASRRWRPPRPSSSSARGPRPSGSATRWRATRPASSSPARRCGGSRGATAGGWSATPSRSRRACRASSWPVTSATRSIKRVASAVGEGAMAVRLVHEYLGGLPAGAR